MSHDRIRLTERLRLEPIGPRHAGDLLALYQDPAVAGGTGNEPLGRAEEEAIRIARAWQHGGVHK